MTAGEIAGLIAAVAFVALVAVLAYPLVKLGRLLDETRVTVRDASERVVPMLENVNTTVESTNVQLERVDAITSNVQEVSGNVAGMSTLFAATLGGPMVKLAAFSYGVRQAFGERRRRDVERRVKAEMRGGRRKRKGTVG